MPIALELLTAVIEPFINIIVVIDIRVLQILQSVHPLLRVLALARLTRRLLVELLLWLLLCSVVGLARLSLAILGRTRPPILWIALPRRLVEILLELVELFQDFLRFIQRLFRFLFLSGFEELNFIFEILNELAHFVEVLDYVFACLLAQSSLHVLLVDAVKLADLPGEQYVFIKPLFDVGVIHLALFHVSS